MGAVILIILSATAGAVGYRLVDQQPITTVSPLPEVVVESASPDAQVEPAPIVVEQEEKPTSATTTYSSERYGFTLQYPSNWYIVDNKYSVFFSNVPFSNVQPTPDMSQREEFIMLALYQDEDFRNKSIPKLIEDKLVPNDSGRTLAVISSMKINGFDVVEVREGIASRFMLKHENLLLDFVVTNPHNKEQEIAVMKQMIASLHF